MPPTPDASWPAQAVAGFLQREELHADIRLAIFVVVTVGALLLFVMSIASTVVLKARG